MEDLHRREGDEEASLSVEKRGLGASVTKHVSGYIHRHQSLDVLWLCGLRKKSSLKITYLLDERCMAVLESEKTSS
jgi:hypothetical protein